MLKIWTKFALILPVISAPLALASIDEIAQRLTGTFNNNIQYLITKKSEQPHNHLHFIHTKFTSDSLNGNFLYVEQKLATTGKVYRQRIYNLVTKNNRPTLEIYKLNEPNKYLGAHDNPGVLRDLSPLDIELVPGCDIIFSSEDSEGIIKGYTTKDSCRIESRGQNLKIETRVILATDYIDVYDESFDEAGNPVWFREDGEGSHMKRARYFTCWSVLRKHPSSNQEGWEISKNNKIHDQGGQFSISYKQRSFDITLSQLVYGDQGKKVLKLGFHKKDQKPTFAYTWANTGATNIGLNLGYLQAGCTLN